MKTIGLIGGMSWESSQEYYRIINQEVNKRLGSLHSAKSILSSVDFGEIEVLQHQGRWDRLTDKMIEAAHSLERAGADCIVLCTNTMHKLADEMEAAIHTPFIHITDAVAAKIREKKIEKVGLLGTKFTMEEDFYKKRLLDKYGVSVLIPNEAERTMIHDVIYNELCLGKIRPSSRELFIGMIQRLIDQGADGIILGCTEIPLLIKQEDFDVPIFDTTRIHAISAVDFALSNA